MFAKSRTRGPSPAAAAETATLVAVPQDGGQGEPGAVVSGDAQALAPRASAPTTPPSATDAASPPVAPSRAAPMIVAPPSAAELRAVVFRDTNVALAISLRLTMAQPAFARLPFGQWAGVLAAQAARGHTRFFLDPRDAVVGFFGFALTDRAGAEAWAFRNTDLPDAACRAGDCVIFNSWVATSTAVNAAMLDEVRNMGVAAAYYRRFYASGRIRAVRLPVTDPRFPTRSVPRRAVLPPGAEP